MSASHKISEASFVSVVDRYLNLGIWDSQECIWLNLHVAGSIPKDYDDWDTVCQCLNNQVGSATRFQVRHRYRCIEIITDK